MGIVRDKQYQSIAETVRLMNSHPQESDSYRFFAGEVYQQLSGAAKDTLIGLVKNGPLWDGDVPSKVGRTELVHLGLAEKVVVKGKQGYQAATYTGWDVYQIGYEDRDSGAVTFLD